MLTRVVNSRAVNNRRVILLTPIGTFTIPLNRVTLHLPGRRDADERNECIPLVRIQFRVHVMHAINRLTRVGKHQTSAFGVNEASNGLHRRVRHALQFKQCQERTRARRQAVRKQHNKEGSFLTFISRQDLTGAGHTKSARHGVHRSRHQDIRGQGSQLYKTLIIRFRRYRNSNPFQRTSHRVSRTISTARAPMSLTKVTLFETGLPRTIRRISVNRTITSRLLRTLINI